MKIKGRNSLYRFEEEDGKTLVLFPGVMGLVLVFSGLVVGGTRGR